jgi:hypothetical protein
VRASKNKPLRYYFWRIPGSLAYLVKLHNYSNPALPCIFNLNNSILHLVGNLALPKRQSQLILAGQVLTHKLACIQLTVPLLG